MRAISETGRFGYMDEIYMEAALTLRLPCSGPTQSQLLLGLAVSHAAAFCRELLDCCAP